MKVRSAENAMKQVLIHDIEAPDKMFGVDAVSKLNADWRQMSMLMAVGRDRRDMVRDQFRRARQRIDVDIRARNISRNFKRRRCFSKEGALTQDNSGSIGTIQ